MLSDNLLFGNVSYLFRRSFFLRLFLSGASRESFVIFGAWRSPLWTNSSILTTAKHFEAADRDQARIEELEEAKTRILKSLSS